MRGAYIKEMGTDGLQAVAAADYDDDGDDGDDDLSSGSLFPLAIGAFLLGASALFSAAALAATYVARRRAIIAKGFGGANVGLLSGEPSVNAYA
jgi:hypothetical protein